MVNAQEEVTIANLLSELKVTLRIAIHFAI